jgi:hypothetical protein
MQLSGCVSSHFTCHCCYFCSIHYTFYMLEWRFFSNSLLYLKNLVVRIGAKGLSLSSALIVPSKVKDVYLTQIWNTTLTTSYMQRHTVMFVFLTLLLLWHSAMFEWAWCHEDERCEGDDYTRVSLCTLTDRFVSSSSEIMLGLVQNWQRELFFIEMLKGQKVLLLLVLAGCA